MPPHSAPGHNVKLSVKLYVQAVLAAEMHGRTVGQWVEMACTAQLVKDEQTAKLNRFAVATQEAMHDRKASPLARDFGLRQPFE